MVRNWGVYLVAILSILFLVLTLAGLYVWWPLSGKWRHALSLAWPSSGPRRNFELHKIGSIYLAPVLIVLLVSGIYLDASR